MDDIVKKIYKSGLGCNLSFICTSVSLYADSILLLTPSVHALQAMLLICEQELLFLDLCFDHNKSVSIRFNAACVKLTTCNGHEFEWVNICCYLGDFLLPADHSNVVGKSVKPVFTAPLTLSSVALVDTLRLK